MWVFWYCHDGYSVGFFMPNGTWYEESNWPDTTKAGRRVNYLNGGTGV